MSFPNPRLATMPAERMRARCVLAERFISSACVADNDGDVTGITVSRGAQKEASDTITLKLQPNRNTQKSTTLLKFKTDVSTSATVLTLGSIEISFNGDTVRARHTDGVTTSDYCEITFEYDDNEEHLLMYSVDLAANVHTLFVDTETPDTNTTAVAGSIAPTSDLIMGFGFWGTVYYIAHFEDYFDSNDFSVFYDETLKDFKSILYMFWRCNSEGDDTIGHYIRDAATRETTITKGDSVTPSTIPLLGGDNGDEMYVFDATTYLSEFPTLPDAFTISFLGSDIEYDGRFLTAEMEDTAENLIDDIETPGGFGFDHLHSLAISNRELFAIEKLHLEYLQKYPYWRSTCTGIIHHLITEGACRAAFLFNCPTFFRDISKDALVEGTRTGIYISSTHDYMELISSGGNLGLSHTSEDTDFRAYTFIVFGELDAGTGTRGIVSKGSGIDFHLETNKLVFNSSNFTITEGAEMYAVSGVTGSRPRFFQDDLFKGLGVPAATVSSGNTSNFSFGNVAALNAAWQGPHIKAFLAFDASLTDNEIIALYYALKKSFDWVDPGFVATEIWQDTVNPANPIKIDTIDPSNDIKRDRIL